MTFKLSYLALTGFALLSLISFLPQSSAAETAAASPNNPSVKEALSKIKVLEAKMKEARAKSIDVTREETVVWFAKEFLKFADWDENNQKAVTYLMGEYLPYREPPKTLSFAAFTIF